MDKKPLTFQTLEACLIAREPVYLAEVAALRRQFDARVADPADWLKDYLLRLDVQCILHEDDPEFDEDDDNFLAAMTFDMRVPLAALDGASHLYECLRNDPLLSMDTLNRIGCVWADVVVVVSEGIADPPTDAPGLNAVLCSVSARYADPNTNLGVVLHSRQEDPNDWLIDHEIEFEIRYFAHYSARRPASDTVDGFLIGRECECLVMSFLQKKDETLGDNDWNLIC